MQSSGAVTWYCDELIVSGCEDKIVDATIVLNLLVEDQVIFFCSVDGDGFIARSSDVIWFIIWKCDPIYEATMNIL